MLGFVQLNLKTEYTLKKTAHQNASSFKSRGQNLGMWLKTSSMSLRDVFLCHLWDWWALGLHFFVWRNVCQLRNCLPWEQPFSCLWGAGNGTGEEMRELSVPCFSTFWLPAIEQDGQDCRWSPPGRAGHCFATLSPGSCSRIKGRVGALCFQ